MFGQRITNDEKPAAVGAPDLPLDTTAATAPAMPDDHAVTQMFTPATSAPAPTPVPAFSGAAVEPTPTYYSAPTAPAQPQEPLSAPVTNTDDLIRMKQEALQHLQPLVSNLQQSPEEEFRTLMMMIQATDDRTMLQKALEAAKRITDDKMRAQAMLDVINEINYFTQSVQQDESSL